MNETSADQGTPAGQAPTPGYPTPPPPHQDLDRLRRSVDDRYIAGVAGGIGRHFGVDPTVVRVLLAVLAFFGGAGVLVYAVCWLFVPEDGKPTAAIHVGSEPRKLLILAAVGVGFLLAVGDAFSGFNAGWPIASLAVVIAIVLIARDRKGDKAEARAAQQQAQAWATPYPPAADAGAVPPYAGAPFTPLDPAYYSAETTAVPPTPPTPPAPPSWQPPLPPIVPPRPKRTGVVWFWPTLALIAIALGTLGIVDGGSTDVAAWVYPATALAISGAMLLVGSFVGRPGGLILLGIVSTIALSTATVVGGFNFSGREIQETPKTAAAVQSEYTAPNGQIELDLTEVADLENLAGRTLKLNLHAGEIEVIVPKGLNVEIDAEFDFAGGITIPGYDSGGIQDHVERSLVGTPANDRPALKLELDASVGQITVEQR